MIATLSWRDQEWVLSSRDELAQVWHADAENGDIDMTRVRQILNRQLAEAEDPAAVERVWQVMMRRTADPRRAQHDPPT